MKIYVLITSDKTIAGVYSTRAQLLAELTTTYAATDINDVEV